MRSAIVALLCGALWSCAAPPIAVAPQLPSAATGVTLASLPGWTAERVADAMPGLIRDCARLALAPPDQRLGGSGSRTVRAGDWAAACAAARAVPPADEAAARAFLLRWFRVVRLTDDARPDGLFTGYDEPEIEGSRERTRRFAVPVMSRPADLDDQTGEDGVRRFGRLQDGALTPYATRAEIDAGALRRQRLDLLYLRSPVDLFFLQLQGAGRVLLPGGQVVRLGYAAGNGQPYVPIGRILAERGNIAAADVSAQTIRAWLEEHPREARATMELNPSYTFFREVPGLANDSGPLGTLGVPLQPLRSIAVDPRLVPLGSPVWIDTTTADGGAIRRLMLAQDTGSAIEGAVRMDIFFGWGPEAEAAAGRQRAPGRAWALLPAP